MEIWFNISQALLYGYVYILPFLLLSYWILKRFRPFLKEVIIGANILSLVGYTLKIYFSLMQLKEVFQTTDDQTAHFYQLRIFGPYGFAYWIPFITSLVMFVLLLFKKPRNSVWISLCVVLFSFPYFYERLVILVTHYFRDYLPSSWSVYYSYKFVIAPPLGYIVLLFITHMIRKQLKGMKIKESTNLQQ